MLLMNNSNVFLLLEHPDISLPDIIFERDSSLKIKVFAPAEQCFIPTADEIQFYALNEGKLLAFETYGVYADDLMDTIAAIRWYTNFIGQPEMEILPDDPRNASNVAV